MKEPINLHIGIDLDNTILDATVTHLQYYNLASGKSLIPEDVNNFYIYQLYGWDDVEREVIYTKYGHDIHWNSPPLPSAIEVLQQLFEQHQISFITSRPSMFREVSINWLVHHKVNYHNIVFSVEDKLQECIHSQVDVLIDDGPHYADVFALANKPLILYEQPYNLHIKHEQTLLASNWMEVKKHIDDLDEKLKQQV